MSSSSNSNDELINKIIHLMKTDESADAPADSIKWAKNVFRTRVASVEPKKSLVQKVLAVLQMDLSGVQPAFGERSASSSAAPTRQMLFQAGENSVDLRITQGEKGSTIQGQILGEGFAVGIVKLGDFQTETSELSEFKFTEIPNGTYDLILQSAEREITIAGLKLN